MDARHTAKQAHADLTVSMASVSLNANSPSPSLPWAVVSTNAYDSVSLALNGLCHSNDVLSHNGYRVQEPTQEDIDGHAKCGICGERRRVLDRKTVPGCYHHKQKLQRNYGKRKVYPCCHQRRGCVVEKEHTYLPVPEGQVEMWRCSKLTPAQDGVKTARAAVSMDCEMVEVEGGSSEVAQVCAVDIVTGEVLVDTFVVPEKKVRDWRTPWSGMSEKRLKKMVSEGRTVNGWKKAREELWKHIDENTVMVGQALKHDLEVMRMVHLRVVDTAIVSREAVGKSCKDSFGLKTLCRDILNREIQPDRVGHDCMEDTMAAREVVLCWVQNPEKVHEWAENLRLKAEQSRKNKAQKKEEKRAQRNV